MDFAFKTNSLHQKKGTIKYLFFILLFRELVPVKSNFLFYF